MAVPSPNTRSPPRENYDHSPPPLIFSKKRAFVSRIHHLSKSTAATFGTMRERLACGAIARTCQIVSVYPIDTIKTRIQVARGGNSTGVPLFHSLYRGIPVTLMGQVPYGMLTFGTYETVRARLSRMEKIPSWLQIIISASVGDSFGSLWLTPCEVIKSKTQAGLYPSARQTAAAIFKSSGLRGFYQGYVPALTRDIPFRCIQFTLFENGKRWYKNAMKGREIHPLELLLVGAFSGIATAAVTTPLDVIRTRVMSQAPGAPVYKNGLHCVMQTIKKDGPRGLFKGILPRCMLIGPSSAMFFFAYEASKAFFRTRRLNKSVDTLARRPRFLK